MDLNSFRLLLVICVVWELNYVFVAFLGDLPIGWQNLSDLLNVIDASIRFFIGDNFGDLLFICCQMMHNCS